MKILGDATYDIVIDWLDDDFHPDVQVKRQLASITKIPFKCIKQVLFIPDETYWNRNIDELEKWTRKSTFMARFYGHRYVMRFHLHFEGDNFYFRYMLLGEQLVDENECNLSLCPFMNNITCLKTAAKLVNNTELMAKLKQEWLPIYQRYGHFGYQIVAPFLRRHNVLHFESQHCRLHGMDNGVNYEPYLRTYG
ncbi:uncharacterized protein LOC107369895 [Tetranychus urticae]|uniref:Uncharacterized protein n=1 Tax=Tetranychus urticae TaxID=32264 RepID=T1L387_TETUR|nr:uncharacterized protein LOC107369895 [Tetranychus urticae]